MAFQDFVMTLCPVIAFVNPLDSVVEVAEGG